MKTKLAIAIASKPLIPENRIGVSKRGFTVNAHVSILEI